MVVQTTRSTVKLPHLLADISHRTLHAPSLPLFLARRAAIWCSAPEGKYKNDSAISFTVFIPGRPHLGADLISCLPPLHFYSTHATKFNLEERHPDLHLDTSYPVEDLNSITMSFSSTGSAVSTWQEKLQEKCRERQYSQPVFTIISDRRGGRTAWSSTVTVSGQSVSARFWYDGQNLHNAKEDAAEVALKYLGESSPSSLSRSRW